MDIFSILTLFGGLAMFLYGMKIMGAGLKESSSGSLKNALETLTSTSLRGFLLGLVLTAVIQSSTATIVITAGLVGAGLLSLHQSLGIVIGANVGTTVTGQIIRLLDVDASGTSFLQFFKPSTLAPIALIIGIVLIMFCNFKNSDVIGQIAMGFGILFVGLLNMTDSVSVLSDSGAFESLFSSFGANPMLGYAAGAGVSFILQSSSATVGILQALSTSGQLTFNMIYAIILGIYLGDCTTTFIVCAIGAKADQKRVGMVTILFNIFKTIVVFIAVGIAYKLGLLNSIWNMVVDSGDIANANTLFNIVCAILLWPMMGLYEKWSCKIIKDDPVAPGKYDDVIEQLNPVLYDSPMLAFKSSFEVLFTMLESARSNIEQAFGLLTSFDQTIFDGIEKEEDGIDRMTDQVSNYLVHFAPHLKDQKQMTLLNHYLQMATEFERLGDHAMNIAEEARDNHENAVAFSDQAVEEISVLYEIISQILDYTNEAFAKSDAEAARHIEPLEEVVDDLVIAMKRFHMQRLSSEDCSMVAGTSFMNMLGDVERISDVCSNVGVDTVVLAEPSINKRVHDYISELHAGGDARFNKEYKQAHDQYFSKLHTAE